MEYEYVCSPSLRAWITVLSIVEFIHEPSLKEEFTLKNSRFNQVLEPEQHWSQYCNTRAQLSSSENSFNKLAERSLNSISAEEKHLEPRYLSVDLKDNNIR